MRYALIGITLIHGISHFAGYDLIQKAGGNRLWSLFWVLLGLAFLALAAGILWRQGWWLQVLPFLVLLSTVCCAIEFREAKIGLIANLLVFVLACAAIRYPGDVPAISSPSLEALWQQGTGTAPAVRLRMRGEIKLGAWHPFVAEEVLSAQRGMIWAGTVSMWGLPLVGADEIVNGRGALAWRVFGLIPVAQGEGPDMTRSAIARFLGETVAWLPSILTAQDKGVIEVSEANPDEVSLAAFGETTRITYHRDANGEVVAYSFPRWHNPEGGEHRYMTFGVVVEEYGNFDGVRIPSRLRAGWGYGSPGFEPEGVFFRAVITDAVSTPSARQKSQH